MSTDKQIHLLFKACPQFLFELANVPNPGPCKVQSVEVKALARTADAVFTPRDAAKPIVIVEIQAQKEKTIYNRIIIEMAQVQLDHEERSIQGIIVFGRRSFDPKTHPWTSLVQAVYLDEALKRLKAKDPAHPLVAAFSPMFIRDESVLEKEAAQQYRFITQSKLGKVAEEVLEQIFTHWLCERLKHLTPKEIAMILKLPDISKTRVAQEFREEGLELGLVQGLTQGQEQAMIESILRVGTKHFGAPPASLQKMLVKRPLSQLKELLDVVLDSPNWKTVVAWLKAR
jgi:predicted transposase YdaD